MADRRGRGHLRGLAFLSWHCCALRSRTLGVLVGGLILGPAHTAVRLHDLSDLLRDPEALLVRGVAAFLAGIVQHIILRSHYGRITRVKFLTLMD